MWNNKWLFHLVIAFRANLVVFKLQMNKLFLRVLREKLLCFERFVFSCTSFQFYKWVSKSCWRSRLWAFTFDVFSIRTHKLQRDSWTDGYFLNGLKRFNRFKTFDRLQWELLSDSRSTWRFWRVSVRMISWVPMSKKAWFIRSLKTFFKHMLSLVKVFNIIIQSIYNCGIKQTCQQISKHKERSIWVVNVNRGEGIHSKYKSYLMWRIKWEN